MVLMVETRLTRPLNIEHAMFVGSDGACCVGVCDLSSGNQGAEGRSGDSKSLVVGDVTGLIDARFTA